MENNREERFFSRQYLRDIGICLLVLLVRYITEIAGGVCMQLDPPLYQPYALPTKVIGSIAAGVILGWSLLRTSEGVLYALILCGTLVWLDQPPYFAQNLWVNYAFVCSAFLGGVSYTALARWRFRRANC